MPLLGRQKEIKHFENLLTSSAAEFIAVYGRRRVGKTYLIHEYFKNKGIYVELTGRKGASKSLQLKNFAQIYADVFNQGVKHFLPTTWDEAFYQLHEKIEQQTLAGAFADPSQKIILFFDELPWLAAPKSGFLEALDLCWNRYLSRNPHVILIVCGSAAEWMIKKIIANKAGLHNRLTRPPIQLMPFTLSETEAYFKARRIVLERKQIVDIYMALGGVAYYLNLVPAGKSSPEILQQLFFMHNAPLRAEFYHLFASLFQHSEKHVAIIKVLAATKQGLTHSELMNNVDGLSSGGGSAAILEELENCGFILKMPEYGKKKKEARYRLIDAFSLFFLRWVEGVGDVGESYWPRKMGSAAYFAWAGYAFENLCFQHYPDIIKALELSVMAEAKSGWFLKGNQDEDGAQIDLIIDRADKCMNLCEIKFYDDEFVIDKAYAATLRRKKTLFREKSKTRKTLFTTMISTYGVKKNSLYFECVDQQLTMDVFFD